MELELRNVGIIKSAHLDFIQGLNLIIGSSSSGKSTLLRAIKSMMDNSFSDSNISFGQRKMAIRMVYNDHTATYVRDLDNPSRKTAYQIDGKLYTKVGRTSLDDLSYLFKLAPVEIDGEKVNFNFSAQFAGPFLLLGSPSFLYSILTYRTSFDITKINDLYATDYKKTKKDIDALEKTKETLEKEGFRKLEDLNRLSAVPDLYTQVQVLKNKNEDFIRIRKLLNSAKSKRSVLEGCIDRVNKINAVLEKLTQYNDHYDTFERLKSYNIHNNEMVSLLSHIRKEDKISKNIGLTLNTYQCCQLLSAYSNKMRVITHNTNILKGIDIPEVRHLKLLIDYCDAVKDIPTVKGRLQRAKSFIDGTEVCCNLYKTTKLISEYVRKQSILSNNKRILNTIAIPNADGMVYLRDYTEKVRSLRECEEKISKINYGLDQVTACIKDSGICPLCQQPLCNC